MKNLISHLLTSLIVSCLVIAVYHFSNIGEQESYSPVKTSNSQDTFPVFTRNFSTDNANGNSNNSLPSDFTFAAEKSMPSVVHIKSIKKASYRYQNYDPFFDLFGLRPQQRGSREMVSTGSGVIISQDGYIVTNNHVIEDGDRLEVTLYDNRSYIATVLGTDPSTDLGLIKIEANGLSHMDLANSDRARVGDWVLAVGNPFNLSSTVTAGIVSAIGRDLEIIKDRAAIESFIQTDAAVNPGNSGGALVNLEGKLVGVNTAIASPTGAYAGYAFAVPANIVGKVIRDLKQYGAVQRGFLGIREVVNLNGTLAKEMGIRQSEGVLVETLSKGGAAEVAGIRKGDVIVRADGIKVKNDTKLGEIIGRKGPGDPIELIVDRDGNQKSFIVSLTNQKGTTDILGKERNELLTELGAEFGELSKNEKRELTYYDIQGGVKVSKLLPGKLRQHTDMREGFVILKVNDNPVYSPEDLTQILEKQSGKVKLEGYYPGTTRLYAFSIEL